MNGEVSEPTKLLMEEMQHALNPSYRTGEFNMMYGYQKTSVRPGGPLLSRYRRFSYEDVKAVHDKLAVQITFRERGAFQEPRLDRPRSVPSLEENGTKIINR